LDRARDRLRHRGQERRRPPEPPRGDPRRGGDRGTAPRSGRARARRRVREGGVTLAGDIARFCRLTWDRGLVSAAGGNISARIGDTDTFLTTPSGVALRDTEPDDLVTIDLAGRTLAGPERCKPPTEAHMHPAIYAARPATRAVAHLHPPHAIAFGIRGEPIPLVTVTSEERLHHTPVVPPAPSGSPELAAGVAAAVAAAPADTQVMLLARHGIIAWGASVEQACDVADLAEYTARIAIAHAALPARRRVIDISVPNARGMHVYPGDPVLRVESVRRIADGDPCNLSLLTLGSHTGTHVDAPYHFLADGPRLGDVGLDRMIGEALVADLRGRAAIDAAALDDVALRHGDILLCLPLRFPELDGAPARAVLLACPLRHGCLARSRRRSDRRLRRRRRAPPRARWRRGAAGARGERPRATRHGVRAQHAEPHA